MTSDIFEEFTAALADLKELVPEVEAFAQKTEAEGAVLLQTAEEDVVKDLQALLAQPAVANFIQAASALDPALVSQIEALLAKL